MTRFVPVKCEETQGAAVVSRVRELLIRYPTRAVTSLRVHFSDFGTVVSQGASNAMTLIAIIRFQNAISMQTQSLGLGSWH